MTVETELLEALDWRQYACQCTQHADACPNPVAYAVAIHAIGRCNHPDAGPFGDRIELRCYSCVIRLQSEVLDKLLALSRYGRASCGSCGAPLAEVADVVRSVTPL